MLIRRAPDTYEKLRHLGGMATNDVLDASPGPPTERWPSRQDTPYRGGVIPHAGVYRAAMPNGKRRHGCTGRRVAPPRRQRDCYNGGGVATLHARKPPGELALARRVARSFRERGLTLALAEGPTGGRLAERLVRWPGSSRFFLGAVVTYDYRSRVELLRVPQALLETLGAVSEQVVMAMAKGVRRRFGSDVALASTGIAGPGGGTPAKPVGLLWLAVATGASTAAQRHLVKGGTRLATQQRFTVLALRFLQEVLER